MNQEHIWDAIAQDWSHFRNTIFEDVEQFLKDKKGKVLDLGCGSGRNFPAIKGEIYGIDFSQSMVNLAKKSFPHANLTKAQAYNLPFQDNFFDSAIFIACLHCIDSKDNRKKALEELFRVLKPKSQAILTVWSKNQDRIKNKPKEAQIPWTTNGDKYYRYYYVYDQDELKELLESVGFKVIEIKEDDNIVAIVEK